MIAKIYPNVQNVMIAEQQKANIIKINILFRKKGKGEAEINHSGKCSYEEDLLKWEIL